MARFLLLCLVLALPFAAQGNNVSLGSLQVNGSTASCSLRWENSWKLPAGSPPGNHDAVWVFGKIRHSWQEGWQPMKFDANEGAHSLSGGGFHIKPHPLGYGLMVERSGEGSGHVSLGLALMAAEPLDSLVAIRLYAVEMVYVGPGGYFLGDGVSHNSFTDGATGGPLWIEDERAVGVGRNAGQISDTLQQYRPANGIPASFPKGTDGFYCMKYEISQGQLCAMLNTLAPAQQEALLGAAALQEGRYAYGSLGPQARNYIKTEKGRQGAQAAVFAVEEGQWRAANFLDWKTLAAYLDWAHLRPLTELEFEKACRGPLSAVELEFAWGTPWVRDANTPVDDGTAGETVTEKGNDTIGLASHGYAGVEGPLRNGFAADANTHRVTAGAGYYGAMEMSGNLWELCIAAYEGGLQFTEQQGDGLLPENAVADVPGWPGANGNGTGVRGGGFQSGIVPGFRDLAISDRFYAGMPATAKRPTSGGRGGMSSW